MSKVVCCNDEPSDRIDWEALGNKEKTYEKISDYENWIEQLPYSSKTKGILKEVLRLTVTVSGKIYQIGKAVLNFLKWLHTNFPNTCNNMILAAILVLIVVQVPFVGPLLFPVVAPLFIFAGGLIGALEDLKNRNNIDIENVLKKAFAVKNV